MKQVLAPVLSNAEAARDVHLIWLEAPGIAASAIPGQFVMVKCGGDTLLRRPLSIHQVDGDKIALLFASVGKGTQWLSTAKAGDNLDVFGPLGKGFSINANTKNLLLVAGGIGIAPLYFLARHACASGLTVKLLIGGKTAAQIYPVKKPPEKLDVIYCSEDASLGRKGRVTRFIPDYFEWSDQIFACGPQQMYRNMAENFPQLKGKPVQISLEIMMGCGFGVCYGCTIKTKRGLKQVCNDGPVFDLDDIMWEQEKGVRP